MHKFYFLKILVLLFLPFQIQAYDFSFQKGDNLLQIDFESNQIKEGIQVSQACGYILK